MKRKEILLIIIILTSPFTRLQAQQRTAYDLAAWIIAAVDDNDTNSINWALKEGGNIDFKRSDMNALHFAIYKGKTEMVKFLLQKGASTDSVNVNGLTALPYAEKLGKPDIIKLLRDYRKLGALPIAVNKDTAMAGNLLPTNVIATPYVYKVGDTVLHSRDRGKTWEPGIIKAVSAKAGFEGGGTSPYLVENMAKTDKGYRDLNFITSLTRKPAWTDFFMGDWDLYVGLAATERIIDRDVYEIISGGDRLPPLRIKKDGSYNWIVDKKVIKGKWQANTNGPGITLLNGERNADWLMYNTTDSNNIKIYKSDYIILVPIGKYYGNRHGFRITTKK